MITYKTHRSHRRRGSILYPLHICTSNNDRMRPTILTLWEDFADADGSILAAQVAEYPIIVAKRITRTNYAGLSLSTRYNSVILINSPYPQVGRLLNWVRDNRPRLMRYSQQNSLAVDWSLVPAAEHNDTVPIADIQSQPHIQLFYVEGKLSLPTHDQDFYELLCSHCGRQYRTHSPKIIHCASCKQRTMLTSGIAASTTNLIKYVCSTSSNKKRFLSLAL
ncbi:replication protein A 70 kDa DNA-binding subunit D-like isoform X2 [Nicotiana tabacum]|uniref:Replication protein A 70 kDa DNA-binding subunit D-like isoform X2 n=4 Tax=Nicotiana tabacum TaxID=4097 RepID=A0AC58T9Q9_TOBAC